MAPIHDGLAARPKLFEAFIQQQHEFNMDILSRGLDAAQGLCDICWLGDDFAGQKAMLMNPDLWRKYIKPYLAEQVQLARDHGMYTLYHSCGAVRPILTDLIGIGVDALLVFQTSAANMGAESIASEFGGRLALYDGCLDQISWGTDYVGSNVVEYLDLVKAELSFFRDHLNNVLERCGWPTLSLEQIDALLGGNIRSFLGL